MVESGDFSVTSNALFHIAPFMKLRIFSLQAV